jgi:hypothetical protein
MGQATPKTTIEFNRSLVVGGGRGISPRLLLSYQGDTGDSGPGSRISRGVAVSLALATVFFSLLVSACSPEASRPADNQEASRPADASRFSAQVDHPLVPPHRFLSPSSKGQSEGYLLGRKYVSSRGSLKERPVPRKSWSQSSTSRSTKMASSLSTRSTITLRTRRETSGTSVSGSTTSQTARLSPTAASGSQGGAPRNRVFSCPRTPRSGRPSNRSGHPGSRRTARRSWPSVSR